MEPPDPRQDTAPGPVRILRVALRLFAERGFAATGIRDITRAAKVNVSVVYHHFPSKEAILAALIDSGLRRYDRVVEAALQLGELPEERLFALAAVHVMVHVHDSELGMVMDRELRVLQPEWRSRTLALRDSIDARWTRVLHEGAALGVFEIAEPKMARLALIRTCTSVVHWYRSEGPWPVEHLAWVIGDLVLGAVRAQRGGVAVRAGDLCRPSVAALHETVLAALAEVDGTLAIPAHPSRSPGRARSS